MRRAIDLMGERFGKLLVVGRGENYANGQAVWICQCECGQESYCASINLRAGRTKSCGCATADIRRETNLQSHMRGEGPHCPCVRSLAARLGEIQQMLLAIEWDDETDIQQCAWCMFGRQHGHGEGCQFAALLAAALAPGVGEREEGS